MDAPPPSFDDGAPTRLKVVALLDQGMTRAQAARALGISKSTVSYHARRADLDLDLRCARRFDWAAIQRYHDAGHSFRECQQRFGFSTPAWHDAARRGALVARPAAMPIDVLLSAPRNRTHLKKRLLDAGLKSPECEVCGLREWRGARIGFALHHVNGNGVDNRIENLQILCPNCHSQTDTFAGRNRGRAEESLRHRPQSQPP